MMEFFNYNISEKIEVNEFERKIKVPFLVFSRMCEC